MRETAKSDSGPTLRSRAEDMLQEQSHADAPTRLLEAARVAAHELQILKIEVALQAEEIERLRSALVDAGERYRVLHDFTQVGYLTLDEKGVVVEANRTATEQLRTVRGALVGQPFSRFVGEEQQNSWVDQQRVALSVPGPVSFELELSRGDGTPLEADVVAGFSARGPDREPQLCLALLDSTERHEAVRELKRAEQALRESAAHAALAEQRERRSLAADLHDDVSQLLSIAALRLQEWSTARPHAREPLRLELQKLLAQTRQRVSSLSFQLSPPVLYDVGIRAAAEWLSEDLRQSYGLTVDLADGPEIEELDEAMRVTLFRGMRELLLNAARHSKTLRASLALRPEDDQFLLEVSDSGVGFDPEAPSRGFGLANLRSRIEHLGGCMSIDSNPERGTRVAIRVPLAVRTPEPGE